MLGKAMTRLRRSPRSAPFIWLILKRQLDGFRFAQRALEKLTELDYIEQFLHCRRNLSEHQLLAMLAHEAIDAQQSANAGT